MLMHIVKYDEKICISIIRNNDFMVFVGQICEPFKSNYRSICSGFLILFWSFKVVSIYFLFILFIQIRRLSCQITQYTDHWIVQKRGYEPAFMALSAVLRKYIVWLIYTVRPKIINSLDFIINIIQIFWNFVCNTDNWK